jgi:uncharacterized membrane protein YeaQ/YmgE (transglycosylase-associated protein family)
MYITGIDPAAAWTTTPEFLLGSVGAVIGTQGTKLYRYVKLRNETATVAVVAGDMLAYLASPASTDEYHTVVSDNTDAATKPIAAGMAGAAVAGTLATAYYGWVQTHGFATVNQTIAGTPTDGDALFLSTTDKTLTLATAADDPICAFAIDESAKMVRLQCA